MLSTVVLSNENQTCRGWEAPTSTGGGGCHGLQIPSHTHVLLLNQLDDTAAILDKYRQSPFTRTFFSKKIRVTVIGYPILLDIRKQHLRMLTPASAE